MARLIRKRHFSKMGQSLLEYLILSAIITVAMVSVIRFFGARIPACLHANLTKDATC